MSRPLSRTISLSHDTIRQLTQLFGTIINAHRRLGLQLDVPYNTFYRGMNFQPMTPAQVQKIEARWQAWRHHYLDARCPLNDEMALHPMDLQLEPEWKSPKVLPIKSMRSAIPSRRGSSGS